MVTFDRKMLAEAKAAVPAVNRGCGCWPGCVVLWSPFTGRTELFGPPYRTLEQFLNKLNKEFDDEKRSDRDRSDS